MLLDHTDGQMDLAEALCSPTSMLTQTAQNAGLAAERWTNDDFDLSTTEGHWQAAIRLKVKKPMGLWLSPECGPWSTMQNANQRTPEQVENLEEKRRLALYQWESCIRLASLQHELGGKLYIEQPQTCMTWRLEDDNTRFLVDQLSQFCIRDQCFDGLKHPKTGLPMRKSTRIQTNDASFTQQFAQRCTGHEQGHTPIEGGKVSHSTSFYPKPFCSRAVQIWKADSETTPNAFMKKYRNAQQEDDTNFNCEDCHSLNPTTFCSSCSPDEVSLEEIMPVVHVLKQDIPDDDEGQAEKKSEQTLRRVHKNLGHPSNRLLEQILKEAKAPQSVIKIASNLHCPVCARHVRTAPARPANPLRAREL